MRNLIILLIFILSVSCDPPTILILENHSTQDITANVNTKSIIAFDSVFYSDTLVSDELIKLNTIPKYFNKKLKIEKLDSVNYYFILKPNFEILVAPSTIGIPFNSVTYKIRDEQFKIIGESFSKSKNIEIRNKPLKTTIVKIKE